MQWFQRIANTIGNSIGDSLWQANCPLCQRPAEAVLCKDCDRQISACQSPEFLQSDRPISPTIPLYSWGIYDGALKRAIAACKYDNHPQIMEAIAVQIASRYQDHRHTFPKARIPIVPIPLHANKLKSRGFNQAEVAAKKFCDLANLPCRPLLQRVKDTKAQMQTKTIRERQENLSQAFAVQSKFLGKIPEVMLFDDIYTTGATIREAIATLEHQNMQVRGVIAIARPQFTKRKP